MTIVSGGVFCSFSQSQFGHSEIISKYFQIILDLPTLIQSSWRRNGFLLLGGGWYKAGSGSTREYTFSGS
jgi:hypothetical protein